MKSTLIAVLFLTLCALANILVAHFGPTASPYIAFAVVGPLLVLRDALHEEWSGRWFVARMAVLVAAGAGLAYVTTSGAGAVALGSLAGFAAGLTVDTLAWSAVPRTRCATAAATSTYEGLPRLPGRQRRMAH
jgi:predicted lysophospholipase L1 biosynthesis ABC-type transport system permease subunit